MIILLYVIIFFLGASFASFLNVLAGGAGDLRKNIVRDRSICESCKKELRWWELIPVVSWLALSGRCNRCSARIPYYHTLTEILLGGVFVVNTFVVGFYDPVSLVQVSVFSVILYFFSAYDVFHGKVRNGYLYPVIIAAFIVRLVPALLDPGIVGVVPVIAGAFWYFSFFALVNLLCVKKLLPGSRKGKVGFGWGDVKYGILLGVVLGWPVSFLGLWMGIFLGGFIAILLIVVKKGKIKTLPFVPFMSVGAWVALIGGDAIMEMVRNLIML